MNLRKYLKRIIKAVLNRPIEEFTMEKEYVISNEENGRFNEKVAVVTGGTGAIGGAIAWRLGIEGATVFVCGRNVTKINDVVMQLRNRKIEAMPLVLDVGNDESVEKAVIKVIKEKGKVDILVNCAGGSTRNNCANLINQKIEMIDEMLNTNLRGSMLCTRAFGKEMSKRKTGKIINIASVIGEHGKPKFSDYAASKAGIIGYTKSVAQELGPLGINVNCISPGFIQRGKFNEDQLPYLLQSNFMNRVGSAEDIASAVAYMASEEARFITGQNLCVDGERSLGLHGD